MRLASFMPVFRSRIGRAFPPSEWYSQAGLSIPFYVNGTAGAQASEEIDSRILGLTAGSSTQEVWAGGVKNLSCWLASLDISSISPSGNAVLITPLHALSVGHSALSVGATLQWLGASKATYTRTVSSVAMLGTSGASDLSIATLSSALPGDVKPVKILSPNWPAPFPHGGTYIPTTWVSNDTKFAIIQDVFLFPTLHTFASGQIRYAFGGSGYSSLDPRLARQAWYGTPSSGDSGSPSFLVLEGELVLISMVATNTGNGPFVPQALAWINSITQPDGYSVNIRTPVEFYQYA